MSKMVSLPVNTTRVCDEQTDRISNGATCAVSCVDGFRAGVSIDTKFSCHEGIWSGSHPTCAAETCTRGTKIQHARKDCTGLTIGRQCQFSCKDGFDPEGEHVCGLAPGDGSSLDQRIMAGGTCVCASGKYDDESDHASDTARCLSIGEETCAVATMDPIPLNSTRLCGASVQHGEGCSIRCDDGFRASSQFQATLQCGLKYQGVPSSAGVWSGAMPTCDAEICTQRLAIPHSSADCTGYTVGQHCSFTCQNGFAPAGVHVCGLGGSANQRIMAGGTCIFASGIYFDANDQASESARCLSVNEETCSVDTMGLLPLNSSRLCSETVAHGAGCTVSCDEGFRSASSHQSTLQCSAGTWTGSPPTCSPEKCTKGTKVPNSIAACAGYTVGQACAFSCETGFSKRGQHLCGMGGSASQRVMSGGSCVCESPKYSLQSGEAAERCVAMSVTMATAGFVAAASGIFTFIVPSGQTLQAGGDSHVTVSASASLTVTGAADGSSVLGAAQMTVAGTASISGMGLSMSISVGTGGSVSIIGCTGELSGITVNQGELILDSTSPLTLSGSVQLSGAAVDLVLSGQTFGLESATSGRRQLQKSTTDGCWPGAYTAERCCDVQQGPTGDASCWAGSFDFNFCCPSSASGGSGGSGPVAWSGAPVSFTVSNGAHLSIEGSTGMVSGIVASDSSVTIDSISDLTLSGNIQLSGAAVDLVLSGQTFEQASLSVSSGAHLSIETSTGTIRGITASDSPFNIDSASNLTLSGAVQLSGAAVDLVLSSQSFQQTSSSAHLSILMSVGIINGITVDDASVGCTADVTLSGSIQSTRTGHVHLAGSSFEAASFVISNGAHLDVETSTGTISGLMISGAFFAIDAASTTTLVGDISLSNADEVTLSHKTLDGVTVSVSAGTTLRLSDCTVIGDGESAVLTIEAGCTAIVATTQLQARISEMAMVSISSGGHLSVVESQLVHADGSADEFPCDGNGGACVSTHAGPVLLDGPAEITVAVPLICTVGTGHCLADRCFAVNCDRGTCVSLAGTCTCPRGGYSGERCEIHTCCSIYWGGCGSGYCQGCESGQMPYYDSGADCDTSNPGWDDECDRSC